MPPLARLALAAVALLGSNTAIAACPSSQPITDVLTCSSTVSGRVSSSDTSDLGGTCGARDCYSCGSPYANLTQSSGEDAYEFTCQSSGTVTLDISGLDCDLDIYILDSTCDPYSGCEDGSTAASTTTDSVSFTCVAGSTYYVVVEGYGFSVPTSYSGYCRGSSMGDYTLSFDVSAGTGCSEDCDNGVDDDFDGDLDCDDSDCAADPVCACDIDGDGYDMSACGGSDCDDSNYYVNPGAAEACNSLDDDCDGSVDEGVGSTYYRDADGDGYGTSTSTTRSCSLPAGYSANSSDCNDGSAAENPAATETFNTIDDDCDGATDESGGTTWYRDADADGYGTASTTTTSCSRPVGYVSNSSDCNDASSAISPAASETCNSVDDDCDGSVDEGVGSTYYRDADADGYGVSTSTTVACSAPSGYVSNSTDCNDASNTVHPLATEYCNSVDDDCDGSIDESATDRTTYYRDADADGYGTSSTTTLSCSLPAGYVSNSTDCNDASNTVYPSAPEYCDGVDNDCDGSTDEDGGVTWYRDADGDGYGVSTTTSISCSAPSGYVSNDDDCDDGRAAVNPAAAESCNSRDDDCDGSIDEGVGTTWYADTDGDGYGDSGSTSVACSAPSGYVSSSTDCNDRNSGVNPGANEYCDGVDNDCDGSTDESGALDETTWYRDSDGDTYGNAARTRDACDQPSGYVADDTDCDDADVAVNPAASEICDSLDNDCDGSVDESGGTTWYRDADSDAYGSATSTRVACTRPVGYVSNGSDCNDFDSSVSPADPEICNSVDDDCDGSIDESGGTTWYADSDGDGYGDLSAQSVSCTEPTGYVSNSSDCNDDDNAVHPGATEFCNGADDDCDGTVDEAGAVDEATWYRDQDGDGYGNAAITTEDCDQPSGYVADDQDCLDTNAAIYPRATEICDGLDNDCDGATDEGIGDTWYADTDGDGFGDPVTATLSCSAISGYVEDSTDCDDTIATVNPDATEYCNGYDDDCDGVVDEDDAADVSIWYEDADGDGYGTATSTEVTCDSPDGYVANDDDCWDGDAAVNPGAAETADGVDEDCDGIVDEDTDYYDDDGDGYSEAGGDCDDAVSGSAPGTEESCNAIDDDCDGIVDEETSCYDDDLDGYTEEDGDCNDGDDAVNPDETEVADNGVDDDCDGSVDGGVYDPDGDGYTGSGGDCAEEDSATYPGAPETEDGVDNDCDGTVDEGTNSYDDDGDGISENDGDCDDADPGVEPDATEVENGVDDNCDGVVDEGGQYTDDDGDGFSDAAGDCDDADAGASPNGEESANGVDDDCDGLVDEGYDDADGDGYTAAGGDCDDAEGWANPGVVEVCDGVDNNCDGEVDEGCGNDVPIVGKEDGCGCGVAPAGGILPLLLGFVALIVRRRRAA